MLSNQYLLTWSLPLLPASPAYSVKVHFYILSHAARLLPLDGRWISLPLAEP